MRHLGNLVSTLSRQKIEGLTFHFDQNHKDELGELVRNFVKQPERHTVLDTPEDTRGVFLLEGDRKWVLKRNRLVHWKKQLRNYLGLKKVFGLHDLTNEFINLSAVSNNSDSVPNVAGFGYKARFPFLHEEYLLIEFFEDHQTIDDILKATPERAADLLPKVFVMFDKMLREGFVHLDPHPKNILVGPDGSLRLIDFECCSHSVIDHDFSLGFLMGYFYFFWINRYITLEDYRKCCEAYLKFEQPNLDWGVYTPVFERFVFRKVSRTTRYSILTSADAQMEFKKSMARSHPDSVYSVESA